jgi:hypothetical protein
MIKIKNFAFFLVCFIYLLFITAAYAEEVGFLYQLKKNLHAYGWPEEEIAPLIEASRSMNWETMENGYADVIAYSLHYSKTRGNTMTPGEKAELTYQLAHAASNMKAAGYDEDVIVRVSVNTTREFMGTLPGYRKEGTTTDLGEMIRQRIREQICQEGTDTQKTNFLERIQQHGQGNPGGKGKQGQGIGHGPPG